MKQCHVVPQAICLGLALSFLAALPALLASPEEAKLFDGPVGLSSVLTAVFTGVLAVTSLVQLVTIRLARESFIALHRPRLIVRSIRPEFDGSELVSAIQVRIVNAGSSSATITAVDGQLLRRPGNSEIAWEYPVPRALDTPVRLVGGASHILRLQHKVPANEDEELASNICAIGFGDQNLVAWGAVVYKDDLGSERRTGFFRRYDPDARRFLPAERCEEEYQD